MPDLDLRPERRNELTAGLRAELEALIPGSATALRGSLASGTADPYSDIDLCWVVEDGVFTAAAAAAAALGVTSPSVQAARLDPGLARSDRRRLVFIRLAGAPLFWRVDLDIRARSVAERDDYDEANPAARDATRWSAAGSAIENAAAAIKSSLRDQPGVTGGLLGRGYERIGSAPPAEGGLSELIAGLAESCARLEPQLVSLADEVREVAEALLRPPR